MSLQVGYIKSKLVVTINYTNLLHQVKYSS